MTLFKSIRNQFRRWSYREGRTLSRFIAKDVRREILIVSAAMVDEGVITGRVRTTNVLYVSRGLIPEPEFGPATELRINEMWRRVGFGVVERSGEDWRPDFEQALGETFGEFVSPPVPFEDASPHECCEVVWSVTGLNVTPTRLAKLSEAEVAGMAAAFGEHFDCDAPSVESVMTAVAHTLARWPVGSLGEGAEQDAAPDRRGE